MTSYDDRRSVLYADKSTGCWVVLDTEGRLWRIHPASPDWNAREPFELRDESDLKVVPGHYKAMLKLPI